MSWGETVYLIGTGQWDKLSAVIAVGGESQELIPLRANKSRKAFLISNPSSESESIFINFTDDAQVEPDTESFDSVEVAPGQTYSEGFPCTQEKITVTAATTGHRVICKERV